MTQDKTIKIIPEEYTEVVGSALLLDNLYNKYMKSTKFDFLFSPRFWQLFLVGVNAGLITYQQTQNVITSISTAIVTWLGGSVFVGTYDRGSDKVLEGKKIEAGMSASEAREV